MQFRHTFLIGKTAMFGMLLVLAGMTSLTVASGAADADRYAEVRLVSEVRMADITPLDI